MSEEIQDSKELVKVVLLKSVAWPPFYGGVDDVISMPSNRAQVLLEAGAVKLFEAPVVPKAPAPAEPSDAEVEKKVDEQMAGLDELFDKQSDNAAALADLAAQAEAKAPAEKKGKK